MTVGKTPSSKGCWKSSAFVPSL